MVVGFDRQVDLLRILLPQIFYVMRHIVIKYIEHYLARFNFIRLPAMVRLHLCKHMFLLVSFQNDELRISIICAILG